MSEGLASFSKSSYVYDELVCGEVISVSGVVLTGQGVMLRGQILGKNATSGKYTKADSATAILAHDVDTTAGDVTGVLYVQGKFKDNAVILGAQTLTDAKAALRDLGVYLEDVQE